MWKYKISFKRFLPLKLKSHGILHYLLSAVLSKSSSQLIMSIFIFSEYFFHYIFQEKIVGLTYIIINLHKLLTKTTENFAIMFTHRTRLSEHLSNKNN